MDVPDDLAIEILLRLPVKTLVRFKSVCKRWQSLIQSHSFIAKHTKNQITFSAAKRLDQSFLIMRHGKRMVSLCRVDKDDDELFDDDMAFICYNQKLQVPAPDITIRIDGVCNGLVCIHSIVDKIFLWNPAIRDFKQLPQSSIQRPPHSKMHAEFGFGYDSSTNDYKVLQFLFGNSYKALQLEIYSLAANSWKTYDYSSVGANILTLGRRHCTIYRNETFIWLAETCDDDVEEVILSFDMRKEVFHMTPLTLRYMPFARRFPCSCGRPTVDMFPFYDSLALVVYHGREYEKTFQIRTIKDLQGGRDSWTKMVSVGPLSGIIAPYGIRRKINGDLLLFLEKKNPGKFVMYDSSSDREIDIVMDGNTPLQILEYTETLVSISSYFE